MKGLALCTCIAANYLSFARVFVDSFRRFHPGIPLFVAVGDRRNPQALLERDSAQALPLETLGNQVLGRMLLHYDRKQVMVAMKPAILRYLLELGFESALFLDPDMLVTAPLDPVLAVVRSHSMTLTPHLSIMPVGDCAVQRERALLFAGIFNGGFVGVRRCEETMRFLRWWEGRLRSHCVEAVHLGLHFDQRWLDLAPGYLDGLHLLRDPGTNVAYWNLHERQARWTAQGWMVGAGPLRLFHFSGYNPASPERVTRHVPALTLDGIGEVAALYRHYAALLVEAGWAGTAREPWSWDGWRRQWRRAAAQWRRWRPYRPF